ncbi:hypothetical protein B0J11DRAFT_160682 [Dendryphion nanum]|uniref:Karyogamy protein 5 n=1 Tax=Dendryphion nanum TaxID=256645 RepID=A0A9P9IX46_9PLEO|nr:hypothetical protein B0J11DRAFT_160682 [Dendryphion nanum]
MVIFALTFATLLLGGFAQHHSAMAHEGSLPTTDLASILQTPVQQQEILSQALRIVKSMESAPSCNRLAALNLINDCKSLEQAPSDAKVNSDNLLDEVKSEYASRLAVCELLGAKALVPKECTILVPSPHACVKSRFMSFFSRGEQRSDDLCYPEATHAQFERCLRALEARPQSWTSYSNARQNAVVMCHASRESIEREKNLSTYKSLAEVVGQMASSLGTSLKQMQAWIDEQVAFAEQVQTSQKQASRDMQTNREETLNFFSSIMSVFQSFSGVISQRTSEISEEMEQSLERSKTAIEDNRQELRNSMRQLFEEMKSASIQHAATQRNELEASRKDASVSLQTYHDTVVYIMGSFANDLGTLKNDVNMAFVDVKNLSQNLAEAKLDIQLIGSATINIQSALNSTTESLEKLATFGEFTANPRVFLLSVAFLIGIWKANGILAGYIMAIGALSYFLHDFGTLSSLSSTLTRARLHFIDTHLVHSATSHPLVFLTLGSIIVLFLISFAIVMAANSTYIYEYHDECGNKITLPLIEAPARTDMSLHRRHRFNIFSIFHGSH